MSSPLTCSPLSSAVLLLLNSILHMFMIYSFLSLFFVVYVSKVEQAAFQQEFSEMVHTNLSQALEQADEQTGGKIKITLQGALPVLNVMSQMYAQPSPAVSVNNRWLFIVMLGVGVAMLASFVGVVGVLRYSCQSPTCIPLGHLIKENVLIFALIGAAEFLFFTKIAAKFIPVPPSLLVQTLVQRLKSQL